MMFDSPDRAVYFSTLTIIKDGLLKAAGVEMKASYTMAEVCKSI